MHVKKLLLTTVAVLLFVTGAALADSIDFSFSGSSSSGTWSWAGGSSTLGAQATSASVGLVGSAPIPLNGNVLVSFTSGPGSGGSGSLTDPYTFGPSVAGSIVINGCLPGQGAGCTTVTLFTGQFNSGEMAVTGSNNFNFDGVNVSGTINSGVASFFGLSSTNVTGSLDAILSCADSTNGCTTGFGGLVGSGDLILTPAPNGPPPIPEPSSLFLMGSGVLALGAFVRARRRSC